MKIFLKGFCRDLISARRWTLKTVNENETVNKCRLIKLQIVVNITDI